MKKLQFLLLISVLICSFTACKKGDEDPFFSFYSREKRMTGEWKVSEGEIRYHNPPSNSYYENYKADKISINYSDEYYNYIGDGTYYWNFSIKKNGKYTITKFINVIYYKSDKSEEEGVWYFLNKNKNAGYKNKECIAFQPTKFNYNNVVEFESENRNPDVYEIIELKNKEIKLKRTYSYDHKQPPNGFVESLDESFTMIPQDQDF